MPFSVAAEGLHGLVVSEGTPTHPPTQAPDRIARQKPKSVLAFLCGDGYFIPSGIGGPIVKHEQGDTHDTSEKRGGLL